MSMNKQHNFFFGKQDEVGELVELWFIDGLRKETNEKFLTIFLLNCFLGIFWRKVSQG